MPGKHQDVRHGSIKRFGALNRSRNAAVGTRVSHRLREPHADLQAWLWCFDTAASRTPPRGDDLRLRFDRGNSGA